MKTLNLEGIEITHINHASIKMKTQDLVIYADPYQVADEQADLILITHDHHDHLDTGSIMKLQKLNTTILIPEGLKEKINGNLRTLTPGNALKIFDVKITTIAAYNLKTSYHPRAKNYLGYILEILGKRIYIAGDTDKTPEMINLKDIDLAFLPIGGTYTMDEKEAAQAVTEFKPKIVVPYHYGEIPGGGNPQKFAELVGNNAQVKILE